MTSVSVEHRVQADFRAVARQMIGDHLRGEAQVLALLRPQSATPAAADRRHPTALAGAGVVPANRVCVSASGEQRGVEGDLRGRRRPGVHTTRRGFEDRGLDGAWWLRLGRRELQQSQEAGVLDSQSLHLGSQAGKVTIDGACCRAIVRHLSHLNFDPLSSFTPTKPTGR